MTFSVNEAVLEAEFPSVELNVAVTVMEPTGSTEVVNEAWPLTRGTGAELTPFTAKVTVPLRPAMPVTVAVKVTGCPKAEGLAEEAIVVVVDAGLTVCVNEAVLEAELPSADLNVADTELDPTVSAAVVNEA